MGDYMGWVPPYSFITAQPGPRDVCVILFVDGKREGVHHVNDYEQAQAAALRIAQQTKLPVKLLSVMAKEFVAFMGVTPDQLAAEPGAEADRQLVVTTCIDVLRGSNDGAVRREAYDLLVSMGTARQ